MNATEVKSKIIDAILSAVPEATIKIDSDWDTELKHFGIDSLDQMMVLLKVEESIENVEIGEDQAGELTTPNKIYEIVNQQV